MKRIVLISAIAISGLFYNSANAQIRIRLGLNFAPRPVYVEARAAAPVEYAEPANYDGDEDYYYLPEVDAYYSVPEQCYYYMDGDQWVTAAYLPGAYRDYDWRTCRRFEVRAPRPFMHDDYYRSRYNGVAFNGRWNYRDHDNGYANGYRFNHDESRRDDRRFDNDRERGGYDRQYNQNREQHFNNNRSWNQRSEQNRNFGADQQHFAQNNFQRNDRGDRGEHRQARF